MPGEETSSTLVVSLDGTPLTDEVAQLLTEATIDDSSVTPDMFVLRFLDDHATVLDKAKVTIGTSVRLSLSRSGSGAPSTLLEAEVTAFETEFTPAGAHTVVRGYDASHRLSRGRTVNAYVDQKPGDIVSEVARRNGLKIGQVDTALGAVLPHVSQGATSDLVFLQRLAAEVGAVVGVVDGALSFGPATPASEAPGSQRSRDDALVLELGVNLVSLRAGVTAADQVTQVTVRGWDPRTKKEVIGTAQAGTTTAHPGPHTPASVAGAVQKPTWVQPWSSHSDSTSCQSVASAIAARVGGSFAELEGVARGNPALRAGTAVNLVGVGPSFSGRYTLTSTRHTFSAERGYITAFTVSSSSARSLYGLTTGAVSPRAGTVPGVMPAVVTDILDPDELGRVRLRFPLMSDDFVSDWVRVTQPGAGDKRGLTLLPEVNDEVLVAFALGEFGRPYVIGSLHNGKDLPQPGWSDHVDKQAGKVKRRGLTSRTGMVVEMVESADEQRVTIATHGGKQRITLVEKGDAAIEMISEGPLTVTAKKDISLTTSNGDVTLKGTNITIEATSSLSLKGADATLEARFAAQVKGATAKVAGQASAELSASGTTTVRGSLVQIN